jgi:hypothetical protein
MGSGSSLVARRIGRAPPGLRHIAPRFAPTLKRSRSPMKHGPATTAVTGAGAPPRSPAAHPAGICIISQLPSSPNGNAFPGQPLPCDQLTPPCIEIQCAENNLNNISEPPRLKERSHGGRPTGSAGNGSASLWKGDSPYPANAGQPGGLFPCGGVPFYLSLLLRGVRPRIK